MNDFPLSYFYEWKYVPDNLIESVMLEFRDNGAENLVIDEFLSERFLSAPRLFSDLDRRSRQVGIKWFEMHAPFGGMFDLNCSESARRLKLVDEHIYCMNYAADLGSKTYVIHLGAFDCVARPEISFEKMRDLSCESLEKILKAAEKLNLIVALENSFERSNSPDEVLFLLKKFPSLNLGCCFDSGHANFMAPDFKNPTGKIIPEYNRLYSWRGEVKFEAHALEKLKPYIVTCHLHDNNGYGDDHNLPGKGTIDWKKFIPEIKSSPSLKTMQSEVCIIRNHLSIAQTCKKMREIIAY